MARRIAAALCYIGLAHLDRVTILPFGRRPRRTRSSPGRGKGRIFRVFELLERIEAGGHDRSARVVQGVRVAAAAARAGGRHLRLSRSREGFEAGLKILRTLGPRRVRRPRRLAARPRSGRARRRAVRRRRDRRAARRRRHAALAAAYGAGLGGARRRSSSTSAGATTSATCAPTPSGRSRRSSSKRSARDGSSHDLRRDGGVAGLAAARRRRPARRRGCSCSSCGRRACSCRRCCSGAACSTSRAS